jgi:hypothetical protein
MPLRLHGFASSNLEGVLPNIKLGVRNEFPKESCGNHLNPSSLFISPIVSEAFVQNAASKQRRDGPEVAQEQQEHLSLRPRPPVARCHSRTVLAAASGPAVPPSGEQ